MWSVQAAADPDRFQLLTKSSANIINLLRVRIGTWTTSISFLFFLEREREVMVVVVERKEKGEMVEDRIDRI